MSDFERILAAPTQEAMEALLWPWTKQMLRKWRTSGLTEQEGYQLLWVWGRVRVVTSGMRQRRREFRFERNGRYRGLQWASLLFGKDVKTIKRWCEKGLFPGATKTTGGHWRIPPRIVEETWRLHPHGFGRGARTLFGTRIWKEFTKWVLTVFGKRLAESFDLEAAFQDKSELEFSTRPIPPSSEAIDRLKVAVDGGQSDYLGLRSLARRLYKVNPERRVNYQLLADALNINPSTLYRRYTKEDVRSAIKAASKPLTERESEILEQAKQARLTEEEDEDAYFKEMFSQFAVGQDTPSPYLLQRDPNDERY